MPREVITLQFGGFANYVGAHYWNIQDELLGLQEDEATQEAASQIDSAVLYRQGENLHGQTTYTPRLVLFDASGSLGGASARGPLYGETAQLAGSSEVWSGRSEVHRAVPVPKSEFVQQLEEEAEEELGGAASAEERPVEAAARQLDSGAGVRYFTDFLKAPLHPRSVRLLEGVWQGDGGLEGWGDAGRYFSTEDHMEAAREAVRGFAEECDALGGFQCFAEDLSAWGQAAADVLQELRDEYGPSRPVTLFALRPSAPAAWGPAAPHELAERRRRLAQGLSAAVLMQHCNVYVPVAAPAGAHALPLLHWQRGNWFHESALCAAALDSATLPYRLTTASSGARPIGASDMSALSELISWRYNSPLGALSMALPAAQLPLDLQQAEEQVDEREQHHRAHGEEGAHGPESLTGGVAWMSFPGVGGAGDESKFAESVVLQGPRAGGTAVPLNRASEALEVSLLAEGGGRCTRHCALTAQPLPVPLPFPSLFSPTVSRYGDPVVGHNPEGVGHHVVSCPALVRLAGSTAAGAAIQHVAAQFRAASASVQGQSMLDAWGYGPEERDECRERLQQLSHVYDEETL